MAPAAATWVAAGGPGSGERGEGPGKAGDGALEGPGVEHDGRGLGAGPPGGRRQTCRSVEKTALRQIHGRVASEIDSVRS
jgi:hypothetical protein